MVIRQRGVMLDFFATWISQAEGFAGMPWNGQSSSALSKASCTTSSARSRRRGPKIRVSVETNRPD